jgi:protein unc-45
LVALCRRYALYSDVQAGTEATRHLRNNQEPLPPRTALECLKLVLDSNSATLSSAQDSIIVELVQQSSDVRRYFATELRISCTEFFDNLYGRGDGAANCLRMIVLEASLWSSETDRLRVEEDLFQLLLAKLMESGHDLDGRALKGIALLLIANPNRLHPFVDIEGFDTILGCMDIRLPADVRTQATLAIAKYLEVSEDLGRTYFTDFVTSRVSKQKDEDLIVAFSAAAGLFPIVPTITTPLFLIPGFLVSIIPLLGQKWKNGDVQIAFLQLLSAACMDQACRSSISKFCSDWLSNTVRDRQGRQAALAATIITKLRSADPNDAGVTIEGAGSDEEMHKLVHLFQKTMNGHTASDLSGSMEGLAYASLNASVKEELVNDNRFLQSFLHKVRSNADTPDVVIGGLSVISNLTQYTPALSKEQKHIAELKAYANASETPTAPNILDDDDHVQTRCRVMIDAGVMPVLTDCSKNKTSSARSLVDKIMLSLAKDPRTRGKIAQQGGVRLLILHLQQSSSGKSGHEPKPTLEGAHALARILISVDPALVFSAGSFPNITSAVQPLVRLLKPEIPEGLTDQPRDQLPVFESLLALTNLASSSDISPANIIIRSAWETMEDLLLSNHTMIRRASCELMCNLVATDAGVNKYGDGSSRAIQRLHTLLAMAGVDDMATRRAASGAMAMLTEHDLVISGVLKITRGVDMLLGMCQDDSEEIVHRGLVCLKNLANATGHIGHRARATIKDDDGIETVKSCLRLWNSQALLQVGVDTLKALVA